MHQPRAKTFDARTVGGAPRRRWWHSFWLWATVAIVMVILALATHSAA